MHLTNAHCWRVEFTTMQEGRTYASNHNVTVIAADINRAIAETEGRWPGCTIIKAFRGERWGTEGVILALEDGDDVGWDDGGGMFRRTPVEP